MTFKLMSLALASVIAAASVAQACTTILLGAPGHTRLAFSYDFVTDAGAVLVNGRGAERRSVFAPQPDVWRVDRASVTFNQFGPGLPTTGMNDAGLVVTLMWNEGVDYPAPSDEPGVGELELIQRLLDTSATVPEAIAEARSVRVPGMVPIHYFVTDRTGARAILAHQHGTLTVHTGDALPIPALTNIDYEDLLAGLATEAGRATTEQSDGFDDLGGNSPGRFAEAASAIEAAGAAPSTTIAFDALDGVANEMTQWNVVYAPADGMVAFRLGTTGAVHRFDLHSVDLSCRAHPLGLKLDDASAGDIADDLQPFDEAANLSLIAEVYPSFPPTAAFLPAEAHADFGARTLAATRCLQEAAPGR